jgi:hypothetical protein
LHFISSDQLLPELLRDLNGERLQQTWLEEQGAPGTSNDV